MGIEVASSFTRKAPVPLDDLTVVANLTARDAIEAGVRYEGMVCYVVSEGANFQLVGGILNTNWEDFGSGGGGGGGGAIEWYNVDGNSSPDQAFLGLLRVHSFDPNIEQFKFATFVVPTGYKGGEVISLKDGKAYANSTDISKDCQFTLMVALIKQGSPFPADVGALAAENMANSTFMNLTANSALALEPLGITDNNGEIAGVEPEPGDTIVMAIYRAAPNETDGVQVAVQLDLNSFRLSLKD